MLAAFDPAASAVDQARADHHGADPVLGRGQHGVVQRDPRLAARQRAHGRRLVVHLIAGLAGGQVRDDARAAGLEERLAAAGECGEDRLDHAAVLGIGGVDHGIGGARRLRQETGVIERAEQRLDAALTDLRRARIGAHEADHVVTGGAQRGGDRTADVAGRASDEHLHDGLPNGSASRHPCSSASVGRNL